MKRALALAAVLSLFGASAMADCPGHVSASAPAPSTDQQTSTNDTVSTPPIEEAVIAAQTDVAVDTSVPIAK